MEVFVDATSFSSWVFPEDSAVRDILNRFYRLQGFGSQDFYVIRNGRLSDLDEPLQHGAVYHLQPRLCGGKGGFGSMLRALGAQIEKTTNREACRDLSGRRLRDVNHEKEMAEWLKKQTEREAEKEQRRLERLQRKLREPEHRFSDIEYQQQCHELSERLEDSVIKGLQASSSGQAKADDASTMKRLNSGQSEQPRVKRKKTASFWAGLDDLPSSEDDDEAMSSSSSSATVTMATQSEDEEPEQSGSSSVVRTCGKQTGPPDQQETPGTCSDQTGPSDQQESPGTSSDQTGSLDQQESPGSCSDQTGPLDQQEFPGTCSDQTGASEQQETPGTCSDQTGPSDQQESLGTYIDQTGPSDQQETPGTCSDQTGPSDQQETPGTSSDQTGPSDQQESPGTCRDQATGPPGNCEPSKKQVQPVVDLSSVSSVDQLEVLGLDILKEELRHRGLKCGGTLTERAARLFSIKDLSPDQINPALLTKPTKVKRKC